MEGCGLVIACVKLRRHPLEHTGIFKNVSSASTTIKFDFSKFKGIKTFHFDVIKIPGPQISKKVTLV